MRKQFVSTIENILENDNKLVLLLGDIGVWGFNKSFQQYPDRVYNIGILEQSMIGLAAGLAMSGYIPVVHTIAPFIVERSFEQLKLDFGYQKLGGNFVSVGGSYDYAALGCTHHCPADIGLMLNIPEMQIVIPGTRLEFDKLFNMSYANNSPTYFRLSERENSSNQLVEFGKANIVKRGSKATVIAVGTALSLVLAATEDEDVTIIYYTTLRPFDAETLKSFLTEKKILLCEPYYSGALLSEIIEALPGLNLRISTVGVPKKFLRKYGSMIEHDESIGFTIKNIKEKLHQLYE